MEYDPAVQTSAKVDGQPGYYVLLPLTIAGDVATSPVQLVYYLWKTDTGNGTAYMYGVPVPVK